MRAIIGTNIMPIWVFIDVVYESDIIGIEHCCYGTNLFKLVLLQRWKENHALPPPRENRVRCVYDSFQSQEIPACALVLSQS